MDADSLVERVEADAATELERLGSDLLLIALTDADLSTGAVLGAAARSERAAAETFSRWADDEADADAAALFESLAEAEAGHYERVVDELDSDADGGSTAEPNALHAHLRGVEGAAARVGAGVVGRGLVADRTHLQLVSYFVNEADERRADVFRDLREETRAQRDRGVTVLADRDEAARERARAAAVEAIRVAYDAYATSLDSMGLDPRPVC